MPTLEIIDLEDLKNLLNVSEATIRRIRARGELRSFRHTPNGKLYFLVTEVNAYIKSKQTPKRRKVKRQRANPNEGS